MPKKLSLLLAAALFAATIHVVAAEDAAVPAQADTREAAVDAGQDGKRFGRRHNRNRGDREDRDWGNSRRNNRHWNNGHWGNGRRDRDDNDNRRHDRDDGRRGWRNRDNDRDQGGWMQGNGGFGIMRLLRRLDVTPEQQRAMVDAMTENFRAGMLARIDMREARQNLRTLEDAATPDKDAIIAAYTAMGEARGKLAVNRLDMMEKVKAVLTPEQRERLEKFHK